MKKIIIIFIIVNSLILYSEEIRKNLIIGKIKGSETINQEIDEFSEYTIIKSVLKNKGFKEKEIIKGEVIRSLYTIRDQSTYGIYKSYLKKFKNEGFNILFNGEKKELGDDFQDYLYELNPWDYDKNYEYSIPFKSGTENTQFFISAKKEGANNNIYVTINTITGFSNYPIYRIDIVKTISKLPEIKNINDIKINIMKKGRVDIYDIFTEKDQLSHDEKTKEILKLIGNYIKQNKNNVFFIVGHSSNEGELNNNIQKSLKNAELVKDYLIKNFSIEDEKLIPKGLGQLCPIFSNISGSGKRFNNRVSLVLY